MEVRSGYLDIFAYKYGRYKVSGSTQCVEIVKRPVVACLMLDIDTGSVVTTTSCWPLRRL